MPVQQYIEIARKLLHPNLAERHEAFLGELRSNLNEFSRRGTIHSSMYVQSIAQLAADEIKIRIRMITSILTRVVAESQVSPHDSLESDLMTEVKIHAFEAKTAVRDAAAAQPAVAGSGFESSIQQETEKAMQRAVELATGDIALFVHGKRARQSGPSSGITWNIGGSVGAIQTGAGASATVIQNFGVEEKRIVERALNLIEEYLAASTTERPELRDVVVDARVELTKDKPNVTKLRGLLLGVAGTVQTLAAAKPAYEAIQAALAVLGIG